jgi:hypothetical protein
MNQTTLFDRPETFPPASRTSDPATSKAAEQRMNRSGARKTQAEQVLDAVIRRLGDLTSKGLVCKGENRICTKQKTIMGTWEPK